MFINTVLTLGGLLVLLGAIGLASVLRGRSIAKKIKKGIGKDKVGQSKVL